MGIQVNKHHHINLIDIVTIELKNTNSIALLVFLMANEFNGFHMACLLNQKNTDDGMKVIQA